MDRPTSRRLRCLGLLGLLVLLGPLRSGPAWAQPAPGVATRLLFDIEGTGAWRVAFGRDERAPGFQALSGGGQVALGVALGGGFGVLGGARATVGRAGSEDYYEIAGSLILQLQVSERVRLRLSGDGGQVWLRGDSLRSAVIVGGSIGASFDMATFRRFALVLVPRLDVSGFLSPLPEVPDLSLAFGVGVGLRY